MFATMAPTPDSFVLGPQPPLLSDFDSSGLALVFTSVKILLCVYRASTCPAMSASLWNQLPAAAGSLLTNEECFLLLDTDIFDNNDDLFRTCCPTATTKPEYDKYQLQDDVSTSLYPPSPPESKPSRAELANEILEQLDNQCKQENIFSSWLEEKVELPIFENISQVPERVELSVPASAPLSVYSVPQPTEELLREFETVSAAYGVTELTHLTPPQSPPGPATQLLLSYAQQAQCASLALPPASHQEQWTVPTVSAQIPGSSLAAVTRSQEPFHVYECGFEEMESLVRERAVQLSSPLPSGHSSNVSPQSSPPSSPRSSSTDEDWSMPSRTKPYSRPADDRRSRKKEQNKNAATRYRQKKKAEVEVLLSEEQTMRQHNSELSEKCSDLQREIRYLKGLMRDLFKAKGLIK